MPDYGSIEERLFDSDRNAYPQRDPRDLLPRNPNRILPGSQPRRGGGPASHEPQGDPLADVRATQAPARGNALSGKRIRAVCHAHGHERGGDMRAAMEIPESLQPSSNDRAGVRAS